MACINMFNPDPQSLGGGAAPPMSPRISFSNDFVVDPPPPRRERPLSDPDFEFSVGTRPMMAADELFFKGRMLPLRGGDAGAAPGRRMTLRDELRAGDEDEDGRPPKGSASSGSLRWKEFLGLKRAAAVAAKRSEREEHGSKPALQEQGSDGEARAGKDVDIDL